MRYRLAIFDFDGTLADSFPWFLRIVNRLADEHRFRRIEEHEVETLRGRGARQVVAHIGLPAWKLPRVGRDMRRHMARDIDHISLFPGVDRVLKGLADKGIETALVTSNSIDNARRVLGAENAALIRHYSCGAAMFGKRVKLRGVLRGSGIPAAEAICIGDEVRTWRRRARRGSRSEPSPGVTPTRRRSGATLPRRCSRAWRRSSRS